jgi:hypothetical protein
METKEERERLWAVRVVGLTSEGRRHRRLSSELASSDSDWPARQRVEVQTKNSKGIAIELYCLACKAGRFKVYEVEK